MTRNSIELAQRAAEGDRQALDQLVGLYLPALRAYVRAHMGAELRVRESTSDVVQSVCRELLTHPDRFRHPGEDAFRGWLFTTAQRKIANRARDLHRQKRDPARELSGSPADDASSGVADRVARFTSPSGVLVAREDLERLEAALDQLGADSREVLTLAYMAGLSRAEIGRRTGRSEEAVRALLYRATARLTILMRAAEEEGP